MLYLLAASGRKGYGRNIRCEKLSATQSICALSKTKSQEILLGQDQTKWWCSLFEGKERNQNLKPRMISGFLLNKKRDLHSSGTLRSPTLRNVIEERRSQFKPYISPEVTLYHNGLSAVE
jgi:hypothetical protein